MRPSITLILSGIFIAYILKAIMDMYNLYNPPACPPSKPCLKPSWNQKSKFQLFICTSSKHHVKQISDLKSIWSSDDFNAFAQQEIPVNITLPRSTLNNGSLYVHAFLHLSETSLLPLPAVLSHRLTVHTSSSLTKHVIPQAEAFHLLKNANQNESGVDKLIEKQLKTVTHLKPQLVIHGMTEPMPLFKRGIPGDIVHLIQLDSRQRYLPMLYMSDLSYRLKDLVQVNTSQPKVSVTVVYTPIPLGRLRLLVTVEHAMQMMMGLGFTEKDTDEVKSIFFDTSIYLLLLTLFVSAFHLLFDFLAFKNDINFWRKKKTMVGLSSSTLVWRCVSQAIVFLYLLDEDTSLLVLIPAGIGSVIELWKVSKALKCNISFNRWMPKIKFGTVTEEEKQTVEYDSQSMKYLSYVLYPLCTGGAIYSLFYVPHKSWYSWCIQSVVNGVYAFGFLFMLPQLFINYKLKSVAHLPWRAFMYKAFNTFIDDLFAFIITMPIAHRVACFRDDIVFLIYLYQRWLYPVDKKRVNEFGESYETESKKTS